ASYNPSSSSQKGHRCDYGRRQSVTEGQGSIDDFQITKLCHSEADNTVLHSNRSYTATKILSGHIQSQPEGLQKCIAAQRVPDPCRPVENLHGLLPDCEKIPGPSQHLQVTQLMASIDGKKEHDAFNNRMEEKPPSTTQTSSKNSFSSQKKKSNVKKQPNTQNKGKGKAPATKTYSQGYRIPNFRGMPWKMYPRWPEQ
ncbi:hypothetical protein O181_063622, partial [Austropuccinia psidii MF-1]|nr:hypothetical protein [Austropuccinia psidii MF-1]